MEVNWYGISLLIIISFLVLIKRSFRFIDAFVLFISFNSTAIFFVDDETAISLPFSLFFLSFAVYVLRISFKAQLITPKNLKTSISWIVIIAIIAIISEIMPFIINGSYNVLDRYGSLVYYAEEIPLYPKMQWITQLLYFLIGLLITYLISITYRTVDEVKRLLKLLIAGISFMIFWGWFEYLCFFTGIPYPYKLFDHIGMSRFGTIEIDGWPRMSSVTLEPSYLAQLMIPATPFLFWFYQQKRHLRIFSKEYHKVIYIFSIITGLMAYTTTGILGVFAIVGLWLKNKLNDFTRSSRYILITVYCISFIFALIFVIRYLLNVSETFSGVERFKTFYLGLNYFLDFPILGLGWGVFPTYDFVINLLVNFGVLGTVSFSILIYNTFIRLNKQKRLNNPLKPLYISGIESLVLMLLVSQMSGFVYHSQYFWLYLGIALSISSISFKFTK